MPFSRMVQKSRKIDAEETLEIRFELKNSGMGDGKGLILSVKETKGLIGLDFESTKNIDDLKAGQSEQIVLPVKGFKIYRKALPRLK